MLKTKLISFATMSAIAIGALAPVASVSAAEVGAGTTVGEFNIDPTIQEKLTLDSVPDMNFGTIDYHSITEGNATANLLDGNVSRDATRNSDKKINITDTRTSNRTWNLTATMNDFSDGTNKITVGANSGITLGGDTTFSGSINNTGDQTILTSTGAGAIADKDNQEYNLDATTGLTLDRNELLPTDVAGNTFTSDITWTLNDSLTF